MKFLHTSDLHLGRSLHEVPLLEHQEAYLDHLVDLATEHRVDAVLIAGDVYDRGVPPLEAVRVLNRALERLAAVTRVVLTSGNHDSPTRLGFAAGLMRDSVTVMTSVDGIASPLVLEGREGAKPLTVRIFGLPFLEPGAVREALADHPEQPLERSHQAVLQAAMDRVRADAAHHPGSRTVVLAHAFIQGGKPTESERDLSVGGVQSAHVSVFDGIDYVAMGHLHGAQRISSSGAYVQYSGSPLAYSFSEKDQVKATYLVDVGPEGVRDVQALAAPVPRKLSDVRGSLEDLLGPAGQAHVNNWVRVTVTEETRPADLLRRVHARFPYVLQTLFESTAAATRSVTLVRAQSNPVEVGLDFFRYASGRSPSEGEQQAFRDAYEAVLVDGGSQ